MEQQAPRPVNPRRRKRSKAQIFKETYLPVIIAGIAIILIVVFIIGAVSRAAEDRRIAEESRASEAESIANEKKRQDAEAKLLLTSSKTFADSYDYDRAIAVLDTFSGDVQDYPELIQRKSSYQQAKSQLVLWTDVNSIPNLCFQPLIVDHERAFADAKYGSSYKQQYVTTVEFENILEDLYANDYVLVSLSDIITTETSSTGEIYQSKDLYLPADKKPLILTQVNVNYQTYMVDGDSDNYPDAKGAGFAHKLVLTPDGTLACEYIDAMGQTHTGDYDLVPILDAFVKEHPDFSYKGAKALLALTGYDGLFGYRTNAKAEEFFGTAVYEQDIASAKAVAEALRKNGYTLASYTYDNIPYGDKDASTVKSDLGAWIAEVMPILGNVDTLVFAQNSDIASSDTSYSGEKYDALHDAGFRYFIGFSSEGACWTTFADNYVRQGRLLVTANNLRDHANWFENYFLADEVLESIR